MDEFRLPPPGIDPATYALSRRLDAAASPTSGKAKDMDSVRKSAEDFEAVFISQMLTHMWSGVEVNEMFGGGHAEEMFRGVMIQEQGKQIAAAGGLGLADHVAKKMLELQDVSKGRIEE